MNITYPGSLHNHTEKSNFRLRDCIVKSENLVQRAIELGQSVVAITDHETISEAVKVEELRKKYPDIKIIMGNEIYLCRDGLNAENFIAGVDKYFHFILLAKDRVGFQQICELSTRAWNRSYMYKQRRVPTYYQDIIDIIASNKGHVIGSTACLGGFLATKLMEYHTTPLDDLWKKIKNWCLLMQDLFGEGNFFLELQPNTAMEQTVVNEYLIKLSEELNIPFIITCDTHYLKKEDREVHKAYLNSQNGEREVDAFYATTYLMNTNEIVENMSIGEVNIEQAFKNIEVIRDMCEDYSILKPLKIPTLKWNKFTEYTQDQLEEWCNTIPMFKTFLKSDYVGDRELVKATIDGILRHKDLQNKEAFAEINDNLRITWESSEVNKAHWSAYYLNLQKIIDLCWEAGSIVGPGRGSGVGFVLLYCLDITQINPLAETTKTYSWRFLNPERVSVLDIDFDIEGGRRPQVLSKFREFYGEDRVANVTTYHTEGTKSAILTAARGLGIDNDEAQYIASLIPSDRGKLRSLKEAFYGDKDKGFKPVTPFVEAMTYDYPELWEVAVQIEGLISGTGIHAGGVIFVDEPFTESTALMRAPDGTICTQFDLHEAEAVSLIKYDALSVEAEDKIHNCLDLLLEDGLIKPQDTLKELYNSVLNIYELDRTSKGMWEMVWNHKIQSLFQMEKQSGVQGIALIHPESVDELCVLNSVIRLMAPDKDSDTPLETWASYRKDINLWYQEMQKYGLTEEEINWLAHHDAITDGICESQEGLMSLVQEPRLGGNSLTFADKCRKGIAKKQGKLFEECERTFYENIAANHCSPKLAHYVWDVLLKMQRGYSFNRSHCLAYSLVGLQEMNLAYRFPIIYWDCACLITNSGVNIADGNGTTDYAKMARALGDIISRGISVSLVDINKSDASFRPDVENNTILFGMKALSGINQNIMEEIIINRPYKSFKDFMNKCTLTKVPMITLIKSGAFDNLEREWGEELNLEPRLIVMAYYLSIASEPKKRLTMQNFAGLVKKNLVPSSLDLEKKIFEFNRYLKKNKYGDYYLLGQDSNILFATDNVIDKEDVEVVLGKVAVLQKVWDKAYKKRIEIARQYLINNQEELLKQLNILLFQELWHKYAKGSISKWEMESLCFYYHDHELANVDLGYYGLSNFSDLPEEPIIERYWKRGGRKIPIYKLDCIIGTVIAKDDNHSMVSLMTVDKKVVEVKFNREQYAKYKKQISEKQEDGTKKKLEEGWFKRGTKLMLTGYRRGKQFMVKTYSRTATHQIYQITDIDDQGHMTLIHERKDTDLEDEI